MNPTDANSREQAFDAAVSAKLREVMPPSGLREAILAGVPVRSRKPTPGFIPWLGLAAALAVLAGTAIHLRRERLVEREQSVVVTSMPVAPTPVAPAPVAPLAAAPIKDLLVASALKDVLHEKHKGIDADQCTLAAKLGDPAMVLAGPLPVDIPQMRSMGCRTIRVGGRDVYELCFMRQGTLLHLYVAARGQSDPSRSLTLASQGSLEAATWSDAHFDYVLVGTTGEKGMLHLMRVT